MDTKEARKITEKVYKCKRCGRESKQKTNHYGNTWSWGHHNCCPGCPPWAKYPEFGGSTVWVFVREVEDGVSNKVG